MVWRGSCLSGEDWSDSTSREAEAGLGKTALMSSLCA